MRFLRFRKTINIQFAPFHTLIVTHTSIKTNSHTHAYTHTNDFVLSLWPLKRYDDEISLSSFWLLLFFLLPFWWMHGSVKLRNQILIKSFCNRARHLTRNISCYDDHGQKFTKVCISSVCENDRKTNKPDEDSLWFFAINTMIKIDQKWTLHSWMFMIMPCSLHTLTDRHLHLNISIETHTHSQKKIEWERDSNDHTATTKKTTLDSCAVDGVVSISFVEQVKQNIQRWNGFFSLYLSFFSSKCVCVSNSGCVSCACLFLGISFQSCSCAPSQFSVRW